MMCLLNDVFCFDLNLYDHHVIFKAYFISFILLCDKLIVQFLFTVSGFLHIMLTRVKTELCFMSLTLFYFNRILLLMKKINSYFIREKLEPLS